MPVKIRSAIAALALAGIALDTVAIAQTAPAPAPQDAGTGDVVVNMRGVEISDVADQISRITGRTLILDPAVKGVVTVTSSTPLSPSGVWELFQSVLRANGFAAVRSGRAWRIVPAANAVRDGGIPSRGASGQELVTRMVRLQNVPAADVARVVRPLVATFGSVEPLSTPNAVVITDYSDNVRRVEAIARSLDGGSGATFFTMALKNGNATDVAASLQTVLGDGTRVAADARSNTVIVRGTPAAVGEARKMLISLDQPGGATPITRMFRLNYADAETVTDVLRGVLGQGDSADNPVAKSLSDSSSNPFARLSSGSSNGNLSALSNSAASTSGGVGSAMQSANTSGATMQSVQTQTPKGFTTPELTVQPAPELNAVVIRGTPAAIASIEPLITDLDVRRPQVLIEAAIAEITGDDAEQLGVQLGTSGAVLNQVKGAATSFDQSGVSMGTILTALGVPAGSVLGNGLTANVAIGDDFSILVQALGTSTRANLLSTPQITVLDNVAGEFVSGQNVPFLTGSILTNSTTVNPYTTIERKDVGITLRVLPRVNAGDTIRLQVNQEASSIAAAQTAAASDLVTNRRAITTTVLADNGQTIVLGGLTADDYTDTRQQVPILGDIPIVGELFKSRREQHQKRTLFIFLKPTILRDGADAAAASKDRYNRLRADEIQNIKRGSLLLTPPTPRLTVEIDGIY
ncbi:type II secretion system secretin GspD [Sphingomonas sp. HITSZ_GF]|uniref:type II secretion system secretin GspD n=1 Tax=Sphingomonas sp. HITSZ_GF TaxID=3037247 RepID=UPI00240CEF10|nr:type II secretion system secretin GspD [Sphingomonas sp. HITSZ_GF]MDG2533973.1 type II secretion system secretin GspD [Sphingomonas sp. HITSZ_GF]